MRKVVPSTPCEFRVVIKREQGIKSERQTHSKFGSVREAINRMIAQWDEPSNRVVSVNVTIQIGSPMKP